MAREVTMNATFAERIGDEVYVYVRGRLVMKRWLRTGVSATFHVAPSGTMWSTREIEAVVRSDLLRLIQWARSEQRRERVERHWNTQGPDAAGKVALRKLLAEVRADERQRIVREVLAWCDDPDVFDKVAEKSVHAVRAVAYSVRDPKWVKRLKYEVQ